MNKEIAKEREEQMKFQRAGILEDLYDDLKTANYQLETSPTIQLKRKNKGWLKKLGTDKKIPS